MKTLGTSSEAELQNDFSFAMFRTMLILQWLFCVQSVIFPVLC